MKRYFNSFKNALTLIGRNIKTWLLFIGFFNVVGVVLYNIVYYGLYALSLKISGVSYIAVSTLKAYFLCPFTWFFIILCLILCLFLMMIEVSALYTLYDASRRGEKAGFIQILYQGLLTAFKGVKERNISVGIYLLVMLPLMGISMVSSLSYTIVIPGFILNEIKSIDILYILLCIVFVIIFLYVSRLQYSLVAWVLDDSTYKEAVKKSKRMIKKNFIYSVLSVLLTYIIIAAILFGLGALIGLIVSIFIKTTTSYASYIGGLFGLVGVYILGPSILLAQISSLYYEIAEAKGESVPDSSSKTYAIKSPKVVKGILIGLFVACLGGYIVSNVLDSSLNKVKLDVPAIAAHRGDSGNAPENTMPAFEKAVADGCCEWIELDVHQTKDGVIVISHDDSLMRIDGSSRYVHEMTYAELCEVDFGSRFSEAYAGTKVATLDEVLAYCKDKIKLQIEIKPTEYDDHIEEAVVDLIKKYDMVDSCVVLSLEVEPLKRIKEIAPEVTTMYCMAFASGEVTKIDFAEYISVEEQNVTAELVDSMHAQNRQCFVWTINSTDNIQYLVDCGVDVILTDYPEKINEALQSADYLGGLARLLRLFLFQ